MYLNKESLKQQLTARDLIKGFKCRQVNALIETGHLDTNQWLRMDEDMDNEEVTPLILVSRIPASAVEKKDSSASKESSVSGRKTSISGHQEKSLTGQGRIMMAKMLIKNDADVNVKDATGRTALMYASINGLNDLVSVLLRAKSSYRIQDVDGYNALMYALPWPSVVRTYIDYMDEYGRPESSFWRQRNRDGKSLIDLAKDPTPGIGSSRSLQLLTTFITNSSSYRMDIEKIPPIHVNGKEYGSMREDGGSLKGVSCSKDVASQVGVSKLLGKIEGVSRKLEGVSGNIEGISSLTINNCAKPEESMATLKSSLKSTESKGESYKPKGDWNVPSDKRVDIVEDKDMKRSKSMREVWEKEMSDWFSTTPPSTSGSSNSSGDKLPPIRSPTIKYDEWTRRGQSLNRRTTIDFLRSVNPIR